MIFASGLKYVGVGTTALGWMLGVVLVAGGAFWLAYLRPRRAGVDTLLLGPLEAERSGDVGLGRAPSRT